MPAKHLCHAVKKRAAEPPSKVFGGKCSKERKQLTLRKRAAKAKSFVPSIEVLRVALPRLVCVSHLTALGAHQRGPSG